MSHFDNDISTPSHRLRLGPLDQRILDELRELQKDGDPHFLERIMRAFLAESPGALANLAQATSAARAPEIVSAAHSLKSSSANIGAVALSVLCAEMVAAGRNGKISNARETFELIEIEHARVQAALRTELAKEGGP